MSLMAAFRLFRSDIGLVNVFVVNRDIFKALNNMLDICHNANAVIFDIILRFYTTWYTHTYIDPSNSVHLLENFPVFFSCFVFEKDFKSAKQEMSVYAILHHIYFMCSIHYTVLPAIFLIHISKKKKSRKSIKITSK